MYRTAALFSLLFASLILHAQAPTALQPTETPAPQADVKTNATPAHPLTSADLESFFDGIVPLQLERSDIAGASVMVMQNGQVLLQKGYGYADLKSKKPVDPVTTIFRLASISKLFTWISIMQLEEQGKVQLDADINQYLDFSIRPAFGRPVTLRNLMTHTGGFEEVVRDIIITNPRQAPTLRDYLIRNQPERLFAPGTVPAYSNYGVGLAGYIVQRVSGEPFEQYVEQHIFAPLKMVHSTFYQPPPAPLHSLPSEGYAGSTEKPVIGFEIFNPVSAGGVSSTAADMGRLGQALLNGGALDGKRILQPQTLQQMWTPQFRVSDQMPPMCMGFYQDWRNNLHWIGHEGDLVAFHSLFMLEPSRKLMLFISYNSAASAGKTRPELMDMFTDRYFPGQPAQKFLSLPRKDLEAIAGVYQSTRRADSTRLKLDSLSSQRTATVDKEGALHIEGAKDLRGHTIKWKPVGKDLWQEIDGQRRIFALRNPSGEIVRLASDFPGVQLQRVPWYEHSRLIATGLVVSLLVLLVTISASFYRFGRRIFFRRLPALAPLPGTRWLPWTASAAGLLWLLLLVAVVVTGTMAGSNDAMPPTSAWDKYFILADIVTALALGFSLVVVVSAIRTVTQTKWKPSTRIAYSLVAMACLFLAWFAVHWHLIGPTRL